MYNKEEAIVIYSAISPLEFKGTIELKDLKYESINNIILESDNNNFENKFKLTFYTSFSDTDFAVEQTWDIVNDIEKLINYMYDEPMLKKVEVDDAYILGQNLIKSNWMWNSQATSSKKQIVPDNKLPEFKSNLNSGLNNSFNPYFVIYSDLIKMEDSPGKFIMLYSLLSDLFGNQKQVNDYIREQEPNVQEKRTTLPNKNFNEPIYTYLRNKVGHLDKKADIDRLSRQIKFFLPGLKTLTKRAIEREMT